MTILVGAVTGIVVGAGAGWIAYEDGVIDKGMVPYVAALGALGGMLIGALMGSTQGTPAPEPAPPGPIHDTRKKPVPDEGPGVNPPLPAATWAPVSPFGGNFAFLQGTRYRITASVGSQFSAGQVASFLGDRGWTDLNFFEDGKQPADWPPDENLSGLESGRRWLRGEGLHTGPAEERAISGPSVFFPLYRIANVWRLA